MDLKQVRKYYGFSQQTLAQLLGVSRSYIAQVEGGYRNASDPLERQVRALFDVEAARKDAIRRERRAIMFVPD